MDIGAFAYEDCLLKHYIRKEVWLQLSKDRLKSIRRTSKGKPRRLRYFTFCAVGALDVLLLDRERVVEKSETGEFDNVYFFDRDENAVIETRKRIPGANGFPGDFVKVVLQAQDGEDDTLTGLESPEDEEDTRDIREAKQERAQARKFITAFPFDVINLDVEQYLFRPREQLPGKLTKALRNILKWQSRQRTEGRKTVSVNEFTLMFTTQVGPPDLPDDYLHYLRDVCLQRNLEQFQELQGPFRIKSKGRNVSSFFKEDFPSAFKLTVPKSLAELALEADWYVDSTKGIVVCQFERASKDGPYLMLHLAMTICRQSPSRDQRGAGQPMPAGAADEHRKSIQKLFNDDIVDVDQLVIGALKSQLEADLSKLFEHRKRYFDPQE